MKFVDASVEVIVVDDGSSDDCSAVANSYPVKFVQLPANRGRGPARNAGAAEAIGDFLLFIDADVVVHSDTLAKVRAAFKENPLCDALFGSYDDAPANPGWVSQYRNLLHHWTHQHADKTAQHFWTGLGAVRRDVFEKVGGFDEARWANNMEEVEFGLRVVEAGHKIYLYPDILGKHLKSFTILTMIKTDLFGRAIPWSLLMIEKKLPSNKYVTSSRQRISVLGAGLMLAAFSIPLTGITGIVLASIGAMLFLVVNISLWRFFLQKRGAAFGLACIPLHLIHSLCSGLGFGWALILTTAKAVAAAFLRRVNTSERRTTE